MKKAQLITWGLDYLDGYTNATALGVYQDQVFMTTFDIKEFDKIQSITLTLKEMKLFSTLMNDYIKQVEEKLNNE